MTSKNEYIGIDYGHGMTNIDLKTSTRYGVIAQSSCNQEWLSEFDAYYGEYEGELDDFAEPISFTYNKDGIIAEYSPWGPVMIFSSPVTVKCAYCSPCYPGAGDLDNLRENGVTTYGLPADCLYSE